MKRKKSLMADVLPDSEAGDCWSGMEKRDASAATRQPRHDPS
jgi:hypothetical protein